jgi:two-component system cell cycle response regulator
MNADTGPDSAPARVLVIEDNQANALLMDYLLRSYGYLASTAGDGETGVAMALQQRPQLVLCDIQLPGIDGYEVARQLRANVSMQGVQLVALTALAMIGDEEHILSQGFDGYISKPIDPQHFVGSIGRYLQPPARPVDKPAQLPCRPMTRTRHDRVATILAVDDIRLNLELKRGLLEPHGYEVLTAETMARALALARERLPDLIISDVGMKFGDGFEFIAALKADQALKAIPVLFVSSTHWDAQSRSRGLALGAVRYLRRPMDSHLLLGEIRAVLDEHRRAGP